MTSKAQLGQTIRSLRTCAGLTLKEVAISASTSTAYLSKVETGKLIPTWAYVGQVLEAIAFQIQAMSEESSAAGRPRRAKERRQTPFDPPRRNYSTTSISASR